MLSFALASLVPRLFDLAFAPLLDLVAFFYELALALAAFVSAEPSGLFDGHRA